MERTQELNSEREEDDFGMRRELLLLLFICLWNGVDDFLGTLTQSNTEPFLICCWTFIVVVDVEV